MIGSYSVVNSVTTTTGGEVQIADINGGAGAIPDTPVNTAIDTKPPQLNQYVYSAYQVNSLLQKGSAVRAGYRRDHRHHPPPRDGRHARPGERLGAVQHRRLHQRQRHHRAPAPVFDISGIEPHATVNLFRDGVIVDTVVNANPTNLNATGLGRSRSPTRTARSAAARSPTARSGPRSTRSRRRNRTRTRRSRSTSRATSAGARRPSSATTARSSSTAPTPTTTVATRRTERTPTAGSTSRTS